MRLGGFPGMRRWIAFLFLLLLAFYLHAGSQDCCGQAAMEPGQCCHLLCSDDCSNPTVPAGSQASIPHPRPKPVYAETVACPVLSLDLEPETSPPRA